MACNRCAEWLGKLWRDGSYAAGELIKNIIVDEKGSQVIEFKDKQGLVVATVIVLGLRWQD